MSWLTRVNYMRYAKPFLIFSAVLMIAAIVSLATVGLKLGIDFTGGDLLDVQFEGQVPSAQVEQVAYDVLGLTPQVQQVEPKTGNPDEVTEFLIRTPEMTDDVRQRLMEGLRGIGSFTILSEDTVSATVSRELTSKALLALGIALVLQVVYIWFRFELKFGVTAVTALVHDVIVVLGLMSIFRVEVNSAFVAAMLTLLGYSLNDTIVVFDRIRENLRKRKKGEDLEALTTRSIQEVITRSLYTGVSVLFMLLALLIWGGETIRDFIMTLFLGVIAGTYSSIFVASALWFLWKRHEENNRRPGRSPKPVQA